ncbi:MAG: YbjQ family protein [Planctomycetota bacterium]
MIVATTDNLPGYEIVECLGLVRGTTVRARNMLRDVGAIFRTIAGGEVPEYTKLVAEAREQALDRMLAEAHELNADAVVGFRFATSEVAKAAAEIVAYGTAVRLRRDPLG